MPQLDKLIEKLLPGQEILLASGKATALNTKGITLKFGQIEE